MDDGAGRKFWGTLIKNLREEQGISQRVLADQCQVHRVKLRNIERGQTAGDIVTVERILIFLGYELEAFSLKSGEPAEMQLYNAAQKAKAAAEPTTGVSRLLTLKLK